MQLQQMVGFVNVVMHFGTVMRDPYTLDRQSSTFCGCER